LSDSPRDDSDPTKSKKDDRRRRAPTAKRPIRPKCTYEITIPIDPPSTTPRDPNMKTVHSSEPVLNYELDFAATIDISSSPTSTGTPCGIPNMTSPKRSRPDLQISKTRGNFQTGLNRTNSEIIHQLDIPSQIQVTDIGQIEGESEHGLGGAAGFLQYLGDNQLVSFSNLNDPSESKPKLTNRNNSKPVN
jgi:hypothetical protein